MSNVTAMRAGGGLSPIYPQSVEDAYRLSKMAFQAGMLLPTKTGYGDNAVTEEPEATLARGTMLILQGMEIGVPPMQAVQLLAMIKGRITAHSEAVPGILLAHGCKIKTWWTGTEMADDWTCHKELTRPNGDVYAGSYSVADAKRAGLWDQSPTKQGFGGKTKPNDSAWFRNPKRMLNARALGNVGKDGGSDFLKGIAVREEIEDLARLENIRDVTPKPAMLDLPDIPDEPPQIAPEIESQDPPIADVEGFLAKLKEDRDLCESEAELAELIDGNSEIIDRLPAKAKAKAKAILEAD
ncbi:MAG: hypothetical protein CTY28_10305 [Hyphomicrobium sp.]|nr:MAG: hypothetical protein CTY28_10305 [Hyphomicrobium sp.]